MIFGSSFKRLLTGLAVLSIPIFRTQTAARVDWTPFANVEEWKIEKELSHCRLIQRLPAKGGDLKIVQMRKLVPELNIKIEQAGHGLNGDAEVIVTIGKFSSKAEWERFGPARIVFIEYLGERFIKAFQRGQAIEVVVDGKQIAEYSLVGSAAAYREMQRCVDQLYDGPTRPEKIELQAPSPPISAAQPNLETNRAVKPISRDRSVG